jgi:predicted O-methyltransferase YrrM
MFLKLSFKGLVRYIVFCIIAVSFFVFNKPTKPKIEPLSSTYSEDWFSVRKKQLNNYKIFFDQKPNKKCLEIGSFEGMSSVYFAENYCNGENSTLTCIDTFEGSVEHNEAQKNNLYNRFLQNTQKFIDDGKINVIKATSKEALLEIIQKIKSEDDKYDFIYVDGSHLAKDVLTDAVLSWELLKKDGIIVFDDYKWGKKDHTAPMPAIDGFLESYKTMYHVLFKGYQVHLQKTSNTPKL